MFVVAHNTIEKLTKSHTLYIDAGTESDQLLATTKMARKIENAFLKVSRKGFWRCHNVS
jgi:hypothetical protein